MKKITTKQIVNCETICRAAPKGHPAISWWCVLPEPVVQIGYNVVPMHHIDGCHVNKQSASQRTEGATKLEPGSFNLGPPRWHSGKESICQCRRCRFDPWVRKIPWRRKWQPAPVFLPGESHGQRNLLGYSLWGRKESDTTEWLSTHTHRHTHTLFGPCCGCCCCC